MPEPEVDDDENKETTIDQKKISFSPTKAARRTAHTTCTSQPKPLPNSMYTPAIANPPSSRTLRRRPSNGLEYLRPPVRQSKTISFKVNRFEI
jgi:hypothetical protein